LAHISNKYFIDSENEKLLCLNQNESY